MIELDGANRAEVRAPYNQIPLVILKGIAHRFGIGNTKYGRDNWKQGGPEFFEQCWNHAIEHLWNFENGELDDEPNLIAHLEAALWNVGVRLWWESEGKSLYEKQKQNEQKAGGESGVSA